ncbi:MAG: hypothetical protein FJ293_08770 [Planctomycetes bacterium]|nr:hypothetical protein [Planctomycetota bacterium]
MNRPANRSSAAALRRHGGALLGALLCAACRAPTPVEANVEIATPRGIVRAVHTEDGIVALKELLPPDGTTLTFRGRRNAGFFDDEARLLRASDEVALLAPVSSRPSAARFGRYPAAAGERLFVEVRTGDHADLLECHLLDQGARGDLLTLHEGELLDVAQRYCGAGVFAWRGGMLELVGMLNGVVSTAPPALAFIGLDELTVLLPETADYFRRRALPRRADFEFGIPRDFIGEQPAAADAVPAVDPAAADGAGDD